MVRSCLASPFPAGLFSFNGRLALIRSRVAQRPEGLEATKMLLGQVEQISPSRGIAWPR